MDFYCYTDKVELDRIIKQAKKCCIDEALKKLKEFDAMNEAFFAACLPDDTPKPLIKKRMNKLKRMKRAKELKRLLG